jgi:hypothetical protein
LGKACLALARRGGSGVSASRLAQPFISPFLRGYSHAFVWPGLAVGSQPGSGRRGGSGCVLGDFGVSRRAHCVFLGGGLGRNRKRGGVEQRPAHHEDYTKHNWVVCGMSHEQ